MKKEIMEQGFTLKYDEPSKAMHTMDAYEVVHAIRGFADFSVSSLSHLYFDADVKPEIKSIKPGCVEIDFAIKALFLSAEAGLIPIPEDLTIEKLVAGVFGLYKHLKGKPAKEIKQNGHNNISVENNEGKIIQIGQVIFQVASDQSTGEALEDFVNKPLKGKSENLKVLSDGNPIVEVEKEEAKFFKPIKSEKTNLLDNTNEVILRIVKPVLEGGAKWEFHDGARPIKVSIADESFIQKVNNGERFGKGDHLKVLLRSVQKSEKGKLKADFTIEEVMAHYENGDFQKSLF